MVQVQSLCIHDILEDLYVCMQNIVYITSSIFFIIRYY